MNKETPPNIDKRLIYLAALYRLGMHDTVLMMKGGEKVHDLCKYPNLLKILNG